MPSEPPEIATSERVSSELRRRHVLDLLDSQEFVSVRQLATEFGLTEMSVRRDLAVLAREGALTRVRGGAARPPLGQASRQYAEASKRNSSAKVAIARRAAQLLEPTNVVFFYSGSTVARVAANLEAGVKSSLTVVTNSLPILDEVSTWDEPHLVAVGGLYLPAYMAFVGPQALQSLGELSADIAIVGCDGLSADGGLTTPHQLVAEVGSTIVKRARRTIVVADSSKVGRRGFTPICAIDEIDVVVTDGDADPDEIERLRAAGVEVILT